MKMFTERLLSLIMLMTLVVGVGRAAEPNRLRPLILKLRL
jgi:hypothetical protein